MFRERKQQSNMYGNRTEIKYVTLHVHFEMELMRFSKNFRRICFQNFLKGESDSHVTLRILREFSKH